MTLLAPAVARAQDAPQTPAPEAPVAGGDPAPASGPVPETGTGMAANDGSAAAETGDIVVTANRRSEDVTKVPYNISVVGGALIERRGIANFEDLTRQIPNLNVNSAGNRSLNSQRPVMRGLNASSTNRAGDAIEQAPVATYLGNVPFGNLFVVDDIERVEVLRGPQGTLYGAGALGGAVRILPAEPTLNKFSGMVTGTVGGVTKSADVDYAFGGLINVPLSNTLAVRASARYQRDAGFIDKYGVFAREGGTFSPPALADPADPANSPPILRTYKDSNYSKTTSARASLKWEPQQGLQFIAAYNYARFSGQGGPEDNPDFKGGPDPLAPSIIYPKLDKYDVIIRELEPYHRESHMATLDASYDVGFATLSSTTSYTETGGINSQDVAYLYLSLPDSYQNYYVGNPRNPRFNGFQTYDERRDAVTQELRLVSKSGGALDYVVGGYYQREERRNITTLSFPGQVEFANATGQFFNTSPAGDSVRLEGNDTFSDYALFGELTWHLTPRLQVTGGTRIFWQRFERSLDIGLFAFVLPNVFEENSSKINGKAIFKANASYEYVDNHNVYATFSQGFRRGGANAFATVGTIRESRDLLNYSPDTVDNYEVGLKGRFPGGLRYTVAAFWDEWFNPQIGLQTPVNNYAVVLNGTKARSRGIEVEINGKLTRELSFSASYGYVDAKLRRSFCIPTGTAVPDDTGEGILDPCGIRGDKGGRLPGSADHSANLGLLYDHELSAGNRISVDLNAQYTGDILTSLPLSNLPSPPLLPSYWLANAQIVFDHGPIQITAYLRNVFNERGVLARNLRDSAVLGTLDNLQSVTKPRSFGLTGTYKW